MVDSSCHDEKFDKIAYQNALIKLIITPGWTKLKQETRDVTLAELNSQFKLCSKDCKTRWDEKQRLNNQGNGLQITEDEKNEEIAECRKTQNRQSGGKSIRNRLKKSRKSRKNKSRRFRKNKK
jgi:hypothetical protein